MSASDYVRNCPNCGAPITRYGYCEYCGTQIIQPLQMISVRPGIHKLVCKTKLPVELGERNPEAVTRYALRDVRDKMADALTDSIKFAVSREFDHSRFEEVIMVRGELWVADPDVNY